MKPVPSISVTRLKQSIPLNGADNTKLVPESPALVVFMDFDHRQPMVVEQNVSVDDASYLMRITHAKLKLVVDREDHFRGIVSLRDIDSVKVLATASAMGLTREDLMVKDIMTPAHHLPGISKRTLERSRVVDLVEAMEFEGVHYLMVLDDHGHLCGMVSAEEIAYRLGESIDISPVAKDFSEVFSALRVQSQRF